MKLYVSTKKMTFKEDNIEHEIVVNIADEKIIGYDLMIEVPNNDKFTKDIMKIDYVKDDDGKDTEEIRQKIFAIREQRTWHGFPLFEIINKKMVDFDYTKYQYFSDTDRRVALGKKVSTLYNVYSELKLQRKTLKYIMDTLNIEYPNNFKRYNHKIEDIINKNPKEKK